MRGLRTAGALPVRVAPEVQALQSLRTNRTPAPEQTPQGFLRRGAQRRPRVLPPEEAAQEAPSLPPPEILRKDQIQLARVRAPLWAPREASLDSRAQAFSRRQREMESCPPSIHISWRWPHHPAPRKSGQAI